MNEWRFSVSHEERLLFRTAWDDDRVRITRVEDELVIAFPPQTLYKVTRDTRTKVIESVQVF